MIIHDIIIFTLTIEAIRCTLHISVSRPCYFFMHHRPIIIFWIKIALPVSLYSWPSVDWDTAWASECNIYLHFSYSKKKVRNNFIDGIINREEESTPWHRAQTHNDTTWVKLYPNSSVPELLCLALFNATFFTLSPNFVEKFNRQ